MRLREGDKIWISDWRIWVEWDGKYWSAACGTLRSNRTLQERLQLFGRRECPACKSFEDTLNTHLEEYHLMFEQLLAEGAIR